mgnify:CR=1 FL=1
MGGYVIEYPGKALARPCSILVPPLVRLIVCDGCRRPALLNCPRQRPHGPGVQGRRDAGIRGGICSGQGVPPLRGPIWQAIPPPDLNLQRTKWRSLPWHRIKAPRQGGCYVLESLPVNILCASRFKVSFSQSLPVVLNALLRHLSQPELLVDPEAVGVLRRLLLNRKDAITMIQNCSSMRMIHYVRLRPRQTYH